MCILESKKLTVTVDKLVLVRDIDLKIHAGEIHAVVGPNGAGKTSLLNAIIGDIPTYSGELLLCGHRPSWNITEQAKSVAVLPQLSLLNFPYTVAEVVALGRTPHSTGFRLDQQIVREAMLAMDISHLSGRLYTQLSGGEKQRTQLARVMTQIWREEDASQRLLLLDEPTSALDLGHQQQLMEAVQRFAAEGVAIFMVVHDINIAARYADHTLALLQGSTIAQGNTQEILTEPLLKKLFSADLRLVKHPETGKVHVIA
ncbi:heme ABC transporter ATP-binding protein [Teredinibacter franksiae]|uniref:heme ABC transporter ATP-binding protein n=1 Tax=Teredinibacter franksiae TaxID=2761453 RepID=UPI00162694D3|nr:heme ABC transporter ATP-binding protein [Teredinibacter franksiae]